MGCIVGAASWERLPAAIYLIRGWKPLPRRSDVDFAHRDAQKNAANSNRSGDAADFADQKDNIQHEVHLLIVGGA